MHSVKLLALLASVLCILSTAVAQCPSSGMVCAVGQCCSSYYSCYGGVVHTEFGALPMAPGTNCLNNEIVFSAQCGPCTPFNSGSPSSPPVSATTKPITLPTAPPTAPTQAPVAPTKAPTQAPATAAPTQAPIAPTQAPTQRPATQAPTKTPITITQAPTNAPPSGGCKLSDIFSAQDFANLFPNANGAAKNHVSNQYAIFNYSYLLDAAASYPSFACTGDITTRRRELAAFLAHTSQETSGWWAGQPYNWGYYFSTEVGCDPVRCTQYCSAGNAQFPCQAGQGYYGRGPIQLSWNYNYGAVSQALFGSDILLTNPDKIFDQAGTAFKTALWFWMTTQSPKPSCHDVMSGAWTPNSADIAAGRQPGFGMTIDIINGGIECGQPTPGQVVNRVGYFTTYTNYFGITVGNNVYCNTMSSY